MFWLHKRKVSMRRFFLETRTYILLGKIRKNKTKKGKKRSKIRNRNNQAPHLTQDTNAKVTTSKLDITTPYFGCYIQMVYLISADNLCKLIWVQTVWHYYFLIVFLKEYFDKVNFEKEKSADDKKKHKKIPSMQRVKNTHYIIRWGIWKLIKSLSAQNKLLRREKHVRTR